MYPGIWPILWAWQTPTPIGSSADPIAVAVVALRRWCSALTLSSPEPVPRGWGFWAAFGSLGLLLVASVILQGPVKALQQVFDIPGHFRLWAASIRRLRRAGRFISVMIGATVGQWSLTQLCYWNDANRLAEWNLLRKTKTLGELSVEQGFLAALTPLRDVVGLSNNLFLTIAAGVIVFRYSAERWSGAGDGPSGRKATLFWGAAWLIAFYRSVGYLTDTGGLPPGGCMIIEGAVVPVLMLLTDGLLLAWALTELRGPSRPDEDQLDVGASVARAPVALFACLFVLPALYAATAAWLASPYVKSLPNFLGRPLRPVLSILLQGWGLVALQAIAPLSLFLISATPWTNGRASAAIRDFFRVFRAQGGRLVAAFALSGILAGALSATSYFLVLSLPTQPWVLAAADAYAHFCTLPIGLVLLSLLVELGASTLAVPPKP